jgi:hypothetical protein
MPDTEQKYAFVMCAPTYRWDQSLSVDCIGGSLQDDSLNGNMEVPVVYLKHSAQPCSEKRVPAVESSPSVSVCC